MDTPHTSDGNCWACHASLDNSPLLCSHCAKVQPATGVDYFQAFAAVTGGTPRLALDSGALELEFHRLSRRLHPDRFARASAGEQDWSLAATALLNYAYRTLRDPIQRIEYLLSITGHAVGEQNSGRNKSADRQPPADLLEEVFDLNMQLEEMRMNRKIGEDDPSLTADLVRAQAHFQALLAQVDAGLADLSAQWDDGDQPARDSSAKSMTTLLDRRRYLTNLLRDVNEVLSTPVL